MSENNEIQNVSAVDNGAVMNAAENQYSMEPVGDKIMTNEEWEHFAEGDLVVFLARYNLHKISVEDGCGHKATIRVDSKGQYKLSHTVTATL